MAIIQRRKSRNISFHAIKSQRCAFTAVPNSLRIRSWGMKCNAEVEYKFVTFVRNKSSPKTLLGMKHNVNKS
jgi:hypothetical protein